MLRGKYAREGIPWGEMRWCGVGDDDGEVGRVGIGRVLAGLIHRCIWLMGFGCRRKVSIDIEFADLGMGCKKVERMSCLLIFHSLVGKHHRQPTMDFRWSINQFDCMLTMSLATCSLIKSSV